MKMAYVLVGAVVVAGAIGFVASQHSDSNAAPAADNVVAPGRAPQDPAGGNLPPGHPSLAGMGNQGTTLPPGHPSLGVPGSTATALPAGHPSIAGSPAASVDEAKINAVKPATGKNAHRISEIFAERQKLAGQKIRVRGVVVKVTPGIRGLTYLHLRDGSGNKSTHDNDLAATTQSVPKVGDTITLEGTLGLDVDVGIGYRYPALLENSVVINN